MSLKRLAITTLPAVAVLAVALLAPALVTEIPAYAQTGEAPTCSTGTAVPDISDNPGLVSDCEALLAGRDTIAGTATLNWAADTPIAGWLGVTLEESPRRVTMLHLYKKDLTGAIPTELGGPRQTAIPGSQRQRADRPNPCRIGQPCEPGNPRSCL